MKFSLLGLGAAIVGTCHAEVLMASTSSGEHLELHGVMGPFHPPHHVAHPPIMQEQQQQGLNPVVKYAHMQCQTDMHHLCAHSTTTTTSTSSSSSGSGGGNVVVVVPRRTRVPLEDPLLAELLYHASQEKEFPLMRMAFPLEQHQSSLDLLDELTTKKTVPPPVMKRVRGVVPDDTMDQLVEEMLQHSIAFTKTAKVEPTKEEEGSSLLATTKEDLKENIAEQTLGVLVNSLLDHATSASASASSDTTTTTTTEEDDEEESFPYDPTFVSKKISLYGKKILDDSNQQQDNEDNNNKEDEDLRQRLARRLTEVTPFHGMPPCKKRRTFVLSQPMVPVPPPKPLLHLPLPVEMCLWDAKKRHILSLSCEMALNKVLVTPNVEKYYDNNIDLYPIPLKRSSSQRRWSPFLHRPPCHHQRRKAIFHFLFNFVFAFTMFYIIYYGYEKAQSKKKRFHKVKKIMHAIHNDPALKAAVEQSMGQSIQQSQQQSQQEESSSCLSLCDTFFDMLPVFGLVLLLMHVAAYSPNFVIMIGAPILGLTSCYTFVRSIACSSSSSSTDDQDDDDEEELITDNYTRLPQENYNNNNTKKAQTHLYEGVPVQVV